MTVKGPSCAAWMATLALTLAAISDGQRARKASSGADPLHRNCSIMKRIASPTGEAAISAGMGASVMPQPPGAKLGLVAGGLQPPTVTVSGEQICRTM